MQSLLDRNARANPIISHMSARFIEVSLRAALDSGELLAMIRGEEPLGSWEKDGVLYLYWPEEKWGAGILEELKRLLASFGVDSQNADLSVCLIVDQDWNAAWAASLQPIRVGKRIRIRQSWNPRDPEFQGIELVIDPKRAFGAGYHATTQMILEWLEQHIRGGERILDIGTGTGILAMAALRLGAASALAVDNDPEAIECAIEYAAVNGFGSELDLRTASFETAGLGSYDVVVANLDIRALPALSNLLPGMLNPGAAACLSGLQIQDFDEAAEALSRGGLRIASRSDRDDWLTLVVRSHQSSVISLQFSIFTSD
jgi:ribosomal protein L11 methyltransferase